MNWIFRETVFGLEYRHLTAKSSLPEGENGPAKVYLRAERPRALGSVNFQDDQGGVIARHVTAMFGGGLQDRVPQVGSGQVDIPGDQINQAFFAKFVAVLVHTLGNPVSKEDQAVAGAQPGFLLVIVPVTHGSQNHVFTAEALIGAV